MMSDKGRKLTSERMKRDNPMRRPEVQKKSSLSHMGQISWIKGLTHEEILKHYPNGMKGGRPKGYKHSLESKRKMSRNTRGKGHPNFKLSLIQRQRLAERMRKNRQDFDFNFKMFKSLQRNITKPHQKVRGWILEHCPTMNTISNYPIYIGNRYAEIDEADLDNKIAIFIDGNYWHNYPNLRFWDKTVNGYLTNQGWKVYRFWESDIKKNPEQVISILKNILVIVTK